MFVCRALFILASIALAFGCTTLQANAQQEQAQSPLDASYWIEAEEVSLNNGRAVIEIVPGAASKEEIRVYGDPVSGDLNHDGVADSALLLTRTTGGSGTFYYVAAAINRNGRYEGTDAVFLGDRIDPQTLMISHSLVIVDFKDRSQQEPMSAKPGVDRSKYLLYDSEGFRDIALEAEDLLIAGEVVIGHEVRTIHPCGMPEASWLAGDSPALPTIQMAYHMSMSDASPYAPLFMIITGELTTPPVDGFGAGYPSAIHARRLIKVIPGKTCLK